VTTLGEISEVNEQNATQNQGDAAAAPIRRRKRRYNFETLTDIRTEMCRVYSLMRRKKETTADGVRLMNCLTMIQKNIEGGDLATRIEALERALQAQRH
jgi:hypothetical protein